LKLWLLFLVVVEVILVAECLQEMLINDNGVIIILRSFFH